MPQRVFKTRQAWQPHAGSVRLRGRSVRVSPPPESGKEEGVEGDRKQGEGCPITDGMIARRAFEISLTDDKGTPEENWARAERELREEARRERERRP